MSQSSEVIAGVSLADRLRKSRWPARTDLAQSTTGLLLGLFMWGHMFFVSTILISNDAMWMVTKTFEGYYFFGRAFPWIVSVIVTIVSVLFMAHAFLAMRKFPADDRQYRVFIGHKNLLHHSDTSLWWLQVVTGFLLFFLTTTHAVLRSGSCCAFIHVLPDTGDVDRRKYASRPPVLSIGTVNHGVGASSRTR